jgi:hypothetical protein
MSASLLGRLAQMSGDEVSFRTRVVARRQLERFRVVTREPRWDRRHLAQALKASLLDESMQKTVAGERWTEAGDRLRHMLLQRPSRYVLDARTANSLAAEITARWPSAVDEARREADAILAGRFDLLGYSSLSFASQVARVDWHFDPVSGRRAPLRFWADVPFLDPACGDHKVIWELNRHQYFLKLGRAFWLTRDQRYASAIITDLRSWLDSNPPLIGINWASSLELALRSLSWLASMHFLLGSTEQSDSIEGPDDASWLVDVLVGLDAQLNHVERHLSHYFSPNTHLTGEALALYVAGAALPELRRSGQWIATGRSVLLEEIERQIADDGGHVELSTAYHRYTLDFYSLALLSAELIHDSEAIPRFREAVRRLASYMGAVCHDGGRIPAIGDDDGGVLWPVTGRHSLDVRDSLALASVLTGTPVDYREASSDPRHRVSVPEEVLWLAWNARPMIRHTRWLASAVPARGTIEARHLSGTGYVVVRDPSGDHLTFDAGPHGFLNGGHAHSDALSVTLTLGGAPLLIDPGTATYTGDAELRTRLRTSASHNTVTVDERSSAVPAGPFHWRTRATARLETSAFNPAFILAEGTHDGYTPTQHRRLVVSGRDSGWLIVDWVSGQARVIDTHWHFDPSRDVSVIDGGLQATGASGMRAWLLHDQGELMLSHGGAALGWCSPRYGSLVPTFAARIRWADTRQSHTTWIGTGVSDRPPLLRRIDIAGVEDPAAVGVHVEHGEWSTRTLVCSGTMTTGDGRLLQCGDFRSDGRLVQLRTTGSAVSVCLAAGSRLEAPASPFALISAAAPIADLHVTLEGTSLELWATSPPSDLRIQLSGPHRARRMRLNGHEVRLAGDGATDLTIRAAQWGVTDGRAGTGPGPGVTMDAPSAAMAGGGLPC